jgi:precorrin-6B methylase 2
MRRIQVLALLFVAAFCMAVTPVTAHDIEAEYSGKIIYFKFINDNTELEVSYRGTNSSSYSNEYTGNVIIPQAVNFNGKNYPVTSIGEYAFYFCRGLTSVTIPNSVTSIGIEAFFYCSSLTSITIPNSVMYIEKYAFEYCSSLTSVTIGSGVTSIGEYAFSYCSSLTSISIDANNTIFDSRNNCNAIIKTSTNELIIGCANTIIPNSVTSIGYHAFYGCSSLTSVTIGSGVTSIGYYAFSYCSSLTSISIDANNTIYDSRNNCNAIIKTRTNELITGCANTIIPNSVTSIGYGAFLGCSSLTSITIPNSVKSIRGSAFCDCSGLTSVTIPNSVTSIGGYAFSYCSGLTSVTIPNSVTSIGGTAFAGCSSLTCISIDANNTIYDSRNNCNAIIKTSTNELITGCANTIIPNSVTSIGERAFYYCRSLTSITIPNSVTSIGESAFYYCSSLSSVTIPNSVTKIEELAFRNCRKLRDMYCYAKQVPTTGSNVFYEDDLTNDTLHVPASALNDYKATTPWSEFGIIVPIDEEEVDDLQDYLNSFADTEDVLTATTYTRQFKNTQWQSLYVPFSLSYDQWSPYFEVARLTGASMTDDHAQIEATLLTAEDGDLLANTPYLVRAKKTGIHTISFGASQLSEQKENTQALGELLTIKGVNSQRTGLKSSGFRCMIGGSLCYPSTDDYVLPPFRWYAYSDGPRMVINSPVLVVIHDGTTTGITAKSDAGDKDDRHAIYDLSGHRLTARHPSELPKGIYIIDGKKNTVR